jgi:hypothetical protein
MLRIFGVFFSNSKESQMTNSQGEPLPYLYLRSLSQSLSDLLADPLSERTRTSMRELLIAASVALLLSTGFAKIFEVSVGVAVAKPSESSQRVVEWLAFVVTFYLLATYLTGVWADRPIAKMKELIAKATIRDSIDRSEERRKEAREASDYQIMSLFSELKRLRAENKAKLDPMEARMKELDPLDDEFIKLDESLRAIGEETDKHRLALMEELEKAPIEPPKQLGLATEAEYDQLGSMLSTFNKLAPWRLVLEVVFPTLYALVALAFTFWTLRHGNRYLWK